MKKFVLLFLIAMLTTVMARSQVRNVTGKITDQSNSPVAGATITVKGTQTATAANADGTFSIRAKTGDVLVITAVNFEPAEVNVTEQAPVNVVLNRVANELTNVVVTTALGIQRQAKDLGYSSTTITNKTLTQGKSVNIEQALNGKVSGLNISTVNSGVFENAKINIRGIRSLTGNNQPMLVVDGAPTPLGYLSSIPPDDVQSLTVLKSAASAAIYGPDAVNGVIVITTKKGGKVPTVTLTSTLQATKVSFFPKIQKEFGAGAGEVLDPYGNYGYVPYENQQYGPRFDGSMQPVGRPLEDGSVQMLPYTNERYKDKIKFWNSGLTWQNSATIAGEDFYVSLEDAKIKGLIPDDRNRRTSFRFNGGKKYGKFSVNYGINYILQNYDVVNEAGLQTSIPTAYNGGLFFLVMQVASNVPLLDYKDWQNGKYSTYSNYYNDFAVSPYWFVGNIRTKGRSDNLIGNLDVNYQLFPWLRATGRLSTNLSFANFKNTNAPIVVSEFAHATRSPTNFSNQPGAVFEDESYTSRINLDYFLSGERDIAKDFSVKYIAGGMLRQNRSKDVAIGGNNLVVPALYNVAVRSGDAFIPTFGGNTANLPIYGNTALGSTLGSFNYDILSRLISAYASVGFSFKGWANVEFTGRNDWDSRLSKANRSFFYPAANASLVLSDAIPAIKNSNVISYLKLRGAISKSGNVNLNPYALAGTYSQPINFPYGGTAGFSADGTYPDQSIKPEFVNTKEVGIEVGFMKNRINIEATYFNQNNTNQILFVSQSSTTGYAFGLANAADFKNYGVEMDLGLSPLINVGKGRIDFKINATYNDNKVTRTLGNTNVIVGGSSNFIQNSTSSPTANNIAVVGMPAFAFQLTDYARDPATGKVIVDPVTGLPSQAGSQVIKGRSIPLWVIGATPSYSVGNFSFSMTWDYKGGHNFYSGLGTDMDFAGISARSAAYGRERFVFPNSVYWDGSKYVDNKTIQVQDGNYGFWSSGNANTAIATNYFASAASIRLREVNISYTLPAKWLGGTKFIKKATVAAVGKNLFLFVPKSNQWGDPEFNYSTLGNTFGLASSFQSPASRLFGGSVLVQF
ncbi:SusC/RagA family TonB-linked outer membrane protein [Panacibacter sp. DH6]|uniref:SusC/RagA family TonB-linked outer membrane protein n=1 Tax=Panacibacter microcysteis TaxID=2793269 RepID=A0A931GUQ7_9BACT|nr:SusC/RagA family TonB-linked outer membrane protein [Panacibacter microcysteis]MBG9376916.1 SusC/RagA family TonB-linked outer membrane protein [Panacibacter microcysteis]